jgi:hypothetical protein
LTILQRNCPTSFNNNRLTIQQTVTCLKPSFISPWGPWTHWADSKFYFLLRSAAYTMRQLFCFV